MAAVHLADKQWSFIQPSLPLRRGPDDHTPMTTAPPRAFILYMLITGCRWQNVPPVGVRRARAV